MHRRITICKIYSDISIDITFNVSIYHVSQCIAIIGCTDLNNMTNIRTYNFESTSQIIELTLQ